MIFWIWTFLAFVQLGLNQAALGNLLFKSLPPLAFLFTLCPLCPPRKLQIFFHCFRSEFFTYPCSNHDLLVGVDFCFVFFGCSTWLVGF